MKKQSEQLEVLEKLNSEQAGTIWTMTDEGLLREKEFDIVVAKLTQL